MTRVLGGHPWVRPALLTLAALLAVYALHLATGLGNALGLRSFMDTWVSGGIPLGAACLEAILLVEDVESVCRSTSRILARHGYGVLEAPDGAGAPAAYRSGGVAPDLLLPVVVTPNMSGHELREHIAALDPALPVVYMSGYSERHPGVEVPADEAATLLEKPFTPDALLRAVGGALRAGKRTSLPVTHPGGEQRNVP